MSLHIAELLLQLHGYWEASDQHIVEPIYYMWWPCSFPSSNLLSQHRTVSLSLTWVADAICALLKMQVNMCRWTASAMLDMYKKTCCSIFTRRHFFYKSATFRQWHNGPSPQAAIKNAVVRCLKFLQKWIIQPELDDKRDKDWRLDLLRLYLLQSVSGGGVCAKNAGTVEAISTFVCREVSSMERQINYFVSYDGASRCLRADVRIYLRWRLCGCTIENSVEMEVCRNFPSTPFRICLHSLRDSWHLFRFRHHL